MSHDRAFLKRTCTHTLELSRGKLDDVPRRRRCLPGQPRRAPRARRARQRHDAGRSASSSKRSSPRTAPTPARPARPAARRSSSKSCSSIEVAGAEATVRFSFPEVAARARHGAAHRADGHRLSRSRGRRDVQVEIEHGQRVGVVGDNGQGKTTFLRTICGSLDPLAGHAEVGLRLPDGRLRPARLHDAARGSHGGRLPLPPGGAGHQGPADQGRRRQLPVLRRDDREEDQGPQRRRARPARARGPAARAAQRAGARRTGQPSRRRNGRGAGRRAGTLPRHGDLHEPRPALHAARVDVRDRSPRRPRGELSRQLRRLRLPRAQGTRSGPPRRARHVQRRRLKEAAAASPTASARPAAPRSKLPNSAAAINAISKSASRRSNAKSPNSTTRSGPSTPSCSK